MYLLFKCTHVHFGRPQMAGRKDVVEEEGYTHVHYINIIKTRHIQYISCLYSIEVNLEFFYKENNNHYTSKTSCKRDRH